MSATLMPLLGALVTIGASLACGLLLLAILRIELRRIEHHAVAFIAGSACFSLLTLVLASLHWARRGVFYGVAVALVLAAWNYRRVPDRTHHASMQNRWLSWLGIGAMTAFFAVYVIHSWAPETSPDGMGYHLGIVREYWRAHGLVPVRSFHGSLPEGMEMLFLCAYSIGENSAAALVHLAFLAALAGLLVAFGARFHHPRAGMMAAVLMVASPVVGRDAAAAYNDVALTACCFALLFVLEIWRDQSDEKMLVLAGIFAGFATAIKWTGATAILVAALFASWHVVRRRGAAQRALLAFLIPVVLLVGPWIVRNALEIGNPIAPFGNAWFPNPYISPLFELSFGKLMRDFARTSDLRELMRRYTITGAGVGGALGPVFLLAPLSLAALCHAQGRRLLCSCALLAAPFYFNRGTRFLLPALPSLAMTLGIAVESAPTALPALLLFHSLFSWPPRALDYLDSTTWRFERLPLQTILHPEQREDYLHWRLRGAWSMEKVLREHVPRSARILARTDTAWAYSDHQVLDWYHTSEGHAMLDALWTPMEPARQPTKRIRLGIPGGEYTAIRVQLNPQPKGAVWSIAELRFLSQGQEVPRAARWRIHANAEPWAVPFAFDNSAVTRWRIGGDFTRQPYVEVRFGKRERIDSLSIDGPQDSPENLAVLSDVPGSTWQPLTCSRAVENVSPPTGMRRAATRTLKSFGFDYFLAEDSDFYVNDYKRYARFWGMQTVASIDGWTLYRLD